jgi:hypothetical protein
MLHPDVEKLAYLVEEWANTIRQYHGENHWVTWLEKDARRLRNSDFYGVEHLLSAFGGMGSIVDFALVPETGSFYTKQKNRYINWK